MNSSWKQKLNQIFDAHESSIEEELLKVSLAFEACQPSANLTSEPAFFDFLCCRLSAACRKFQLGYIAAKKVETTDGTAQTDDLMAVQVTPASVVSTVTTTSDTVLSTVITTSANGITGVSVTQANGTASFATEATDTSTENLKDASTGNENLAVVDANGTSNANDLLSMENHVDVPSILIKVEQESDDETTFNELMEQSEDESPNVPTDVMVKNDTAAIEQPNYINDIAEEVSTAAVNSNLPEASGSAVVMTEEEIERRIKNIIAAASHWQKNFQSSNDSGLVKRKTEEEGNFLVKRLKTEELNSLSKEESPPNLIVPKNTDAKIHCKHPVYGTKCLLCNKIDTNLVNHYVKEHPTTEIFISRPSPLMIKRIRCQDETFEFKTGIITGMCFFCEEPRKCTIKDWKQHLISHTGEFEFYCSKCLVGLPMRSQHEGCSKACVKHIFDSQANNCALKAYICKMCNYLQINKDNLIKHLVNEHGSSSYELNKHTKKVTLVPNLRPISTMILNGFEFVGSADRYRCGFGQCYAHFGGSVDLLAHFKHLHNRWTDFMCPHCAQLIRWRCYEDILNHYKLHGSDLFQCAVCQRTFATEFDVILHIMRDHPYDEFQYRQNVRSHHYGVEKREITILMECNLCSNRFDNVLTASTHFKKQHESLNVDFTAIQLVKTTTPTMATKFAVDKKPLLFRQFFVCQRCNQSILSKDQLVEHQNRYHKGQEIDLKLSKIVQLNTENIMNTSTFTAKNSLYDRYLLFTCVHCDQAGNTDVFWSSVKEVHSHWKSAHATKPFQFSAALLVSCHYCNFFSTYQGLKTHHEKRHAQKEFILSDLIDPNRCAICEYMGDGLVAHFKGKHDLIIKINNLNPVSLSNGMLNKLTGININRKRQCGHCNNMFETEADIETHHQNEHNELEMSSHKVFDKESLHVITGCCQATLHPHELLDHFVNHKFSVLCSKCHFETSELYEFINHQVNEHELTKDADFLYKRFLFNRYWKTLVVFGNGLTLNKSNLLKTDFDDSKAFQELVESMLKEQKEKYQRKK